jgi:hypothetical protein
MTKFMQIAPGLFVGMALIMQVARVADFGRSINAGGFLSAVFAVFLAGVIFVLAYWDGKGEYQITADEADTRRYNAQRREKLKRETVRRDAIRWLAIFILIDGGLNLAETMSKIPATVTPWQWWGAVAYGALPTLAAWGLGRMQGKLDKLTTLASGDSWIDRLGNVLLDMLQPAEKIDNQPQKVVSDNEKVDKAELTTWTLLDQWTKDPQVTDATLADLFAVSRQAIGQRRATLTKNGYIVKDNAGNVKVVKYPADVEVTK